MIRGGGEGDDRAEIKKKEESGNDSDYWSGRYAAILRITA